MAEDDSVESEASREQKRDEREARRVKLFEKREVIHAPLAIELKLLADLLLQVVKKVPVEFRLIAVLAVLAMIIAATEAIIAVVDGLPEVSKAFNPWIIKNKAEEIEAEIKKLEPGDSQEVLLEAVALIKLVEQKGGAPGGPVPDIPHYFTDRVINHQAQRMIIYILKNAFN